MDKNSVKIPTKFETHPIFNELICGTNFGFLAKRGYYNRPDVKKQPELMKKAGINFTTLNMNFCQDNYYSTKVYLDFSYSTSEYEILEMTKRLHDNGIRVLFKPCLTSLDGAWMGLVKFPEKENMGQIEGIDNDYWKKWFYSFNEAEKYFADLAEKAEIDAMITGAEYFGTEGKNEYWEKVIEDIRNIYHNPITYEFTCDSRKAYNLKWFDKLDFLSYSYYPPACPPNEYKECFDNPKAKDNPSYDVESMKKYLFSRKEKIKSISERFNNMPIAFTEYGVRSSHGSIMNPCNFTWKSYYDGKEQADFMEASFETFFDIPQWMGLFWWKWDETQNRPMYHSDPKGDMGFTIQGKPAEKVMKKWYNKKR